MFSTLNYGNFLKPDGIVYGFDNVIKDYENKFGVKGKAFVTPNII